MIETGNVPVFVLCGGLGTRFREETEFRPKPMIAIGSRPILWHIMRRYARFGFKHFVLCLGYKGEAIKSYFLNYASLNSDFSRRICLLSFLSRMNSSSSGRSGTSISRHGPHADESRRGPGEGRCRVTAPTNVDVLCAAEAGAR